MNKIYIGAIALFLAGQTAVAQQIDRTKEPAAGPAPTINIGAPQSFTMANGLRVMVVEDHKLPLVSASLILDRMPSLEGSKVGTRSLLSEMMTEGTTTKDKAAFFEEVDFMGSSVNAHTYGGSASAMKRYFARTVELMADAVLNPAFNAEAFDKVKSQTITNLQSQEKNSKAIAGRVARALTYGTDHPFGEYQTEAGVNSITLDDVKTAYKSFVMPNKGYLVIVGDITLKEAKALAEKNFGAWKPGTLVEKPLKDLSNVPQTEIALVDLPTAVQSEVAVTNIVQNSRSNADFFALLLANQVLGGGMNGYLMQNLREKHGFTYGAYSSVDAIALVLVSTPHQAFVMQLPTVP